MCRTWCLTVVCVIVGDACLPQPWFVGGYSVISHTVCVKKKKKRKRMFERFVREGGFLIQFLVKDMAVHDKLSKFTDASFTDADQEKSNHFLQDRPL